MNKPGRKLDIYDAIGVGVSLFVVGWFYVVVHFIVKFW